MISHPSPDVNISEENRGVLESTKVYVKVEETNYNYEEIGALANSFDEYHPNYIIDKKKKGAVLEAYAKRLLTQYGMETVESKEEADFTYTIQNNFRCYYLDTGYDYINIPFMMASLFIIPAVDTFYCRINSTVADSSGNITGTAASIQDMRSFSSFFAIFTKWMINDDEKVEMNSHLTSLDEQIYNLVNQDYAFE